MKKCLIFFTLLLITIWIAVLTEEREGVVPVNDIAVGEPAMEKLLAEENMRSAE
ncbi:MAG TPA: hypothetical protein VKN36_05085 [Eudoraea sp.]|nr:hypothetical protein [Eudoraea sp.]